MGKASKWFRGLLGLKKPDAPAPPQPPPRSAAKAQKEKRRWSFVKSSRERDQHQNGPKTGVVAEARVAYSGGVVSSPQRVRGTEAADPNKHAIAVAAATAAVAEAAVAAAHAAAAVVRLTSSGRCGNVTPEAYGFAGEEWSAAVKIQSAFRGYLARKALRALRGLVRLQALVRGHIERKNRLRRMQALLRAQARARAGRSQMSDSPQSSSKSSQAHYMDPATPEKSERSINTKSTKYDPLSTQKRNSSNEDRGLYYERNRPDQQAHEQRASITRTSTPGDDKILEIDTCKNQSSTKRRNLFNTQQQQPLSSDQYSQSFTTSKDSYEVQSLNPLLRFPHEEDNSPQFYSASSRGGGGSSGRSPFTPSKSDGQGSYLSGYSGHPNYMSYTESSKAKARSLSAPKQRVYVERSSSSKRNSVYGFGESRSGSLKVSSAALQASFANKAYPGSGRLDRLGMPVGFRY